MNGSVKIMAGAITAFAGVALVCVSCGAGRGGVGGRVGDGEVIHAGDLMRSICLGVVANIGGDGSQTGGEGPQIVEAAPREVLTGAGEGAEALAPSAVEYRMNGPWERYVAVTLTPDGKGLVSYPAPSDLGEDSTPVALGDGWWQSRCGITADSHFIRYTYEGIALKEAPTPEEIMKALIPGARVVAVKPRQLKINN